MDKKFSTLIIICSILIFTVSACSFSGDSSSPPVKENGISKEQITLRYSSYLLDTAQAGKTYYEAIKEFEKNNPNIKIEADFIQNANYTAGIKTRILGNEKMDIFDTWSPSLFAEFNKLGENIYLDLSDMDFLDSFLISSLEPVTINNKVYAAPEVLHSDGILYNKTMFDKLKIKIPQTWNEFIAVCETLKNNDIIPIAMDSEWWVPQFFWGSIISCNGGNPNWTAKLENGEIKINNPIFVDSIKKLKILLDKGYMPKEWTGLKHEQSKDLIGQEKAGMIITGTWDIPSIMERNENIDVEFMIIPGNDKKPVPNINVGCYRVISGNTQYPQEAKKFIEFMNGKATQEKLAEGAKAVPSFKDAKINDPVSKKIAEVVTREDAALYWPHTVSTESLQVKILEGVNKYLAGDDLNKVLEEIQKAIDEAKK